VTLEDWGRCRFETTAPSALVPNDQRDLCRGRSIALDDWSSQLAGLAILIGAVLLLRLGRAWLSLLNGLGYAAGSFFLIVWVTFDLSAAVVVSLRLLTLGTVFFLFFKTTAPEDLSNALVKLGTPYAFAFVLSASMQFVHVLTRRAANIRDAQRARGIILEGPLSTFRHLPALLGPLLVQAFKLADELAEAMEARGFGHWGIPARASSRVSDWILMAAAAVSSLQLSVERTATRRVGQMFL
jgi:energy-coupling factor transport system permease protein